MEFFSPYHNSENLNKFSLLKKKEKNKIISDLLKNLNVKNHWEEYNYEINQQIDYFKNYSNFIHQIPDTEIKRNKIKMNLYQLFVEQYYKLLKKSGIAGMVLPSGIYSDLGSQGLRKLLFNKNEIISLYGFDNHKGIFKEIHRQFKFLTLVFKKGNKTSTFKTVFYIIDVNQLSSLDENSIDYDIDIIKQLSPLTLSVIECHNDIEVQIIKKIAKFPSLIDPEWNLEFQREFNATDDASLFNTEGKGSIIYKGGMIHQFTHIYEEPTYWIESNKAKESIGSREETKLNRIINKQKDKKLKSGSIKVQIPSEHFRIAWRLISSSTNQRTIICTVLPKNVFLVNSLNYVKPIYFDGKEYIKYLNINELLYLCGMLNSYVIDFFMRRKVQININIFYMNEIHIPKFSSDNPLFLELSLLVGKLICTTSEFDEIKEELKIKSGCIDPSEREKLIIRINVIVAKIIGITVSEFEYILNTFPIVKEVIRKTTLSEFKKNNLLNKTI